jgi:hypothetical protein
MPESLKRQIHVGLQALRDPDMERRVCEHLATLGESPRNVVHAAMIAGRFQREAAGAATNGESSEASNDMPVQTPSDTVALQEALGAGRTAMENPLVEAAVEAYFANNPGYSRDPIHVAAIACQFAARQEQASPECGQGLHP